MKPSSELFKLVKSLSKSEKRFFKLSSSLQSGDKNYLKIFDFIEKQRIYDEEALKEAYKGERFIKHLPSEKNHLYKLILKSLRSFYSDQTVSSLLKQEIKNVEILYNKALFKECEKFVARAKAIAQDYERFYYWFELLSWEKKLLEEAYESGDFNVDLNALIKEESMVIAKLRNLAEYQIIYSKINFIFRSGGFARNAKERAMVNEIADYHLIKGKKTAISTRAAVICYYIKGVCAATNRDYENAQVFFNKTRTILDDYPKLREDNGHRYLVTLSYLGRCNLEKKEYDKAESIIKEMRLLSAEKGFNSLDLEVKIFTYSYNLELRTFHKKGDFESAYNLIDEIENKQEGFGDKVNKENEVIFQYNKAYSCFGIGEYKKALTHLNLVLNDNEQRLRQDIYGFARVFNLILHYEMENYEFLEYLIKSASRYISKQERDMELELTVIKSLRKLAKSNSVNEKRLVFEDLKVKMESFLLDENENVVTEYFHIFAWVDSKLNNISFMEAVKK
ncbi:MAG: hypothetical protein ACI9XP_000953 [Lentimonas sp.]|jgi:hypothetical protein